MSMSIGASSAASDAVHNVHAALIASIQHQGQDRAETPAARAERVGQPAPAGSPDTGVGATTPARVIAARNLEAAERAAAATRPDGAGPASSAAEAPGEKMAAALKARTAKDVVGAAEEKFLQAMMESTKLAADKPAAPGAEGPVGGDGPKGLSDARGMALQVADQKRAADLFQAQVAELRGEAAGQTRTLTDLRA